MDGWRSRSRFPVSLSALSLLGGHSILCVSCDYVCNLLAYPISSKLLQANLRSALEID